MADEAKQMTIAQLVSVLETYITSRERCSYVEERWFASYLIEPLRLARLVRNNNSSDIDLRAKIDHFRLEEIRKEQADKQREIDTLDREAQRIDARLRPDAAA